jgi:hypothetical protein
MADGSTTTTETTNGTSPKEAKADSLLTALDKRWKERTGGKLPDKKTTELIKAKLQKAFDAEQAAVEAQEKAREEFEKASEEALNAFGRRNVSLGNNVLLTPSSRGERIYYKRMTHEDAV